LDDDERVTVTQVTIARPTRRYHQSSGRIHEPLVSLGRFTFTMLNNKTKMTSFMRGGTFSNAGQRARIY
jgi:hypothetical protein